MRLSVVVAALLSSASALAAKPLTSFSCTTQLMGVSHSPIPPVFVRTIEATTPVSESGEALDGLGHELTLRLNGQVVTGAVRADSVVKQHAGRDFLEVRFGTADHWFIVLYRNLQPGSNRGVFATVHQWVPFGLGLFPYTAVLGTAQCDVEVKELAPTELPSYGF